MPPALFDSSVYISALRQGRNTTISARRIADGPLWLSAVVLGELYAGVQDRDLITIERMERDLHSARRILTPTFNDWTMAGRVLARLARKYDYEKIGRARLTNDALIAMGAARLNITVITFNARDFSRLAEFRSFQWQEAAF